MKGRKDIYDDLIDQGLQKKKEERRRFWSPGMIAFLAAAAMMLIGFIFLKADFKFYLACIAGGLIWYLFKTWKRKK